MTYSKQKAACAGQKTCAETKKPKTPNTYTPRLPEALKDVRHSADYKDFKQTKAFIPISRAASVHLMALLFMSLIYFLWTVSPGLAVAIAILSSPVLACLFRGLESLVHGASHYDIFGLRNIKRNDMTANFLMAFPVFQCVVAFRAPHLRHHHSDFDGDKDPCKARMQAHPDTQAGRLPALWATLRSVPRETLNFYQLVGANPGLLAKGLVWHMALYIAPLCLITGSLFSAALIWAFVMGLLFTISLPIIRTLAENGEHDYRPNSSGLSEVERSFNHEGFLNRCIHLWGDDMHVNHHGWPGIPQYNLREFHQRLLTAGYGPIFKYRDTILGSPKRYRAEKAQKKAGFPSYQTPKSIH